MSLTVNLFDPTAKYYEEPLYDANITHNLARMAGVAALYTVLWRPDNYSLSTARDLEPYLAAGVLKLKANQELCLQYSPKNGWGTYEDLLKFVESYLAACKEYPDAIVKVYR